MKITDIKYYILQHEVKPPRFRWREGLPGDGVRSPVGGTCYSAILKVETSEAIG